MKHLAARRKVIQDLLGNENSDERKNLVNKYVADEANQKKDICSYFKDFITNVPICSDCIKNIATALATIC